VHIAEYPESRGNKKHSQKERKPSLGNLEKGQSVRTPTPEPLLLRTLKGEVPARPPIWLMRQAGRYLPEYRALRAKAADFLDLCYHPEWAAEITLQPIRRFGFDGAILFADILLVPDALGQKVVFEEGIGPRLEAAAPAELLARLDTGKVQPKFASICETVERVRAGLGRRRR